MEKYLTKKAQPSLAVRLLENGALIMLFGLLGAVVLLGVDVVKLAWETQTLNLKALLLLLPVAVLALAMNPIAGRIRARQHARLIVKALLAADGCIPVDELEAKCGVRRAAQEAQQLTERGYVQQLRIVRGYVCLGEMAETIEAPAEVTPLFRDVEI